MNELARNYECWIDDNKKVLSFHFVSKYMHKKFNDYISFINYVIWRSQSGFKIQ